jgi:hypothetical protein
MEHPGKPEEREGLSHRYGLRQSVGRTLWLSHQSWQVGIAWDGGCWRVFYSSQSTESPRSLTFDAVFQEFSALIHASGHLDQAQIQLCFGEGAPLLEEATSSQKDLRTLHPVSGVQEEDPLWIQGLDEDLDALFLFDCWAGNHHQVPVRWVALRPLERTLSPVVMQLLEEFSISMIDRPQATRGAVVSALAHPRVLSLQRLQLPERGGASASKVSHRLAEFYFHWIENHFRKLIRVHRTGDTLTLCLLTPWIPLIRLKAMPILAGIGGPGALELEAEQEPGEGLPDRCSYQVVGGWLAAREQKGVLEFLVVNPRWAFARLRDFRPALPGWIYRFTQAPFHAWVMRAFGLALRSSGAQIALGEFEVQKKLNNGD